MELLPGNPVVPHVLGTILSKRNRTKKMPLQRFVDLSAERQALVRCCQCTDFGQIVGLAVCQGQPAFTDQTQVILDIKLDSDPVARPERDLDDFALCAEIVRLCSRLDNIRDGVIDQIEVRAGIPRRIVIKASELIHS
jgi:hypothetical protein